MTHDFDKKHFFMYFFEKEKILAGDVFELPLGRIIL